MKQTQQPAKAEFGSAWPLVYPVRGHGSQPAFAGGRFFGNGRQALLALFLSRKLPAGRLWLPDYFCPEVTKDWAEFGGAINTYAFGPWSKDLDVGSVPAKAGDTVLLLNTLGLFGAPDVSPLRERGVHVVEDHSHDLFSPWARASRADWCIASLRKSLPVPDGGVLWSPAGHDLPEQPELTTAHELAAAKVFAAMALKRDYMEGGFPPKPIFRAQYLEGEAGVSARDLSAASPLTRALLENFPHAEWREQRRAHWQYLAKTAAGLPGLQVIAPKHAEAVPFGLVLALADERARNAFRSYLQERQFYTALLWELEPASTLSPSQESLMFSRSSLVVACDGRYDQLSLEAMAELLRNAACTG